MESDLHRVEADGLDRRIEKHVVARDLEPGGGGRFCDIPGRDGAIELARFAGLAQDHEALAFELAAVAHGGLAALFIFGFENGAVALEFCPVGVGRPQRLVLREEVIAGIAVLDLDDFTHAAELLDALEKNDFHILSFAVPDPGGWVRGGSGVRLNRDDIWFT